MRIAILGFSREGQSTFRFIKKFPLTKKASDQDIWILDKNSHVKIPRGIHAQLGEHYLDNLEHFDIIFRTPGILYSLPALQRARRKGVKISSLIELFFERCPAPVIGITGTKGKGTTASALYAMLKAGKRKVFLAGNIGIPALDILPKITRNSIVILELSSFQLHGLTISPHIAIVMDMFPDHQEVHKNLREYYDAKANISRYQRKSDRTFYLSSNVITKKTALYGKGKKIVVSEKGFSLFKPQDLKVKGYHNFRNTVVAATVARHLRVSPGAIRVAMKKFPGLPHRLEFVRAITLRTSNGDRKIIEFYDDSAATNPYPSSAAIATLNDGAIVLIAGGLDKNFDYTPLAQAVSKGSVIKVILIGTNRKKMEVVLKKYAKKVPFQFERTLDKAIHHAYSEAKRATTEWAYVVLSPGAASFDMFSSYVERGNQFKKIVKGLKTAR